MTPPHPLVVPLRLHLLMDTRHGGHGFDGSAMSMWALHLDELHAEDHEQQQERLTHP